jgi:hypothetical protein
MVKHCKTCTCPEEYYDELINLSPEQRRSIAAMNAGTYAMSDEDCQQWYSEHPLEDFK